MCSRLKADVQVVREMFGDEAIVVRYLVCNQGHQFCRV
jgi:hypothetical protein